MASIDKHNGRYRVRYRVDGASRSKSFTAHREAVEFKTTVEADAQAGRTVDPVRSRTTFGDWWPVWQGGRVGLTASTVATSRSLYINHLSWWDDWTLESIRQTDVQTWVADLTDRKAPATVVACYKDFAQTMKAATVARYIRNTPCVGVNLPRVEQDTMTVLDHADIAKLADAINPRYRALVILLAYSGLRIGEASALRADDLSLDTGHVFVRHTATEVAGKGLILGTPKTAAGRRTVPLPHHVTEALSGHVATYPGTWLFTTGTGAQLNPRAFNRRSFATAQRKAGLSCRVHDLRHTAISLWIRAGVDLPRVKAWAGHTDAAFTLNRYAKFFPTDDTMILERLNENIVKGL